MILDRDPSNTPDSGPVATQGRPLKQIKFTFGKERQQLGDLEEETLQEIEKLQELEQMKQEKIRQAQREVEQQVEQERQKVLKRLQDLSEKKEEQEKLRKQEEERLKQEGLRKLEEQRLEQERLQKLQQERLQALERNPASTSVPGVQFASSSRPAGTSAPTDLPPWTQPYTGQETPVITQRSPFTPTDARPLSVMAIPVPAFINAAPNGSVEQELFALHTAQTTKVRSAEVT